MNHRAVAYSLKCCIAANDLDSLAIQLMEHLDRISFDLKSKTFSATLGGALFGTYITSTVSLDEFKRLYQLVEQFHGRIFDIEVILKSYLHAVAITALNPVNLTNVWQILKILLPFCTTFFSDQTLWSEIHSYYRLNGVFHEIVRGLLDRYGNKKNYEKIPYCEFKVYSLRHLARNEVRASVMKNSSESQEFVRNIMGLEIPFVLRQYLRFQDNDPPILYWNLWWIFMITVVDLINKRIYKLKDYFNC